MKPKGKPKNIEMTGKIIGISEEKEASNLNILLDDNNIEIKVNPNEYRLDDKLHIEFVIKMIKIK